MGSVLRALERNSQGPVCSGQQTCRIKAAGNEGPSSKKRE